MSEEIVGRDEELAALLAFLDDTAGLPSALLLVGGPGAGKTTLWRAGLAAARERSLRVLASSPAPAETQLAFGVLRDLIGDLLPEAVADLPAPQRRALEVALLVEDPDGAPPERGAIAVAFLGALRRLSRDEPVLLALDDAQWVDAPSAGVLEFALRRLEDDPVGILVSHRGESNEPLGLDRTPLRTTRIELGALSPGALHHLLHTRLGLSLSRPMLRRVLEVSGGNPLHAIEIGRALGDRGEVDPAQQLPLPATLHEAVRSRLDALPKETRDALVAVAAFPGASAAQVEAVTDIEDAWSVLQPAVEAQVLEVEHERLRFSHPLLESVATIGADPRARRAIHRRIAATLDDPEASARHLGLAAEPPDEEAAAALEHAAQAAQGRGAPASAAELLELSRRLTSSEADEDGWARRTLAAALAHAEAGEEARGQLLAREVVDCAQPGPKRAEALGHLAFWLSDVDLCEQALVEAGDDVQLRARLEYVSAHAHAMLGELEPAVEHARDAVAAAEAAGDSGTLVRALTMLAEAEGTMCAGDPLARLRQAAALEEATGGVPISLSPRTYLGRWHMRADELAPALELLDGQLARANEIGDVGDRPALLYVFCELEWRAGNWQRADLLAREIGDVLKLDDASVRGQEVAHWAEGLVDAHLGRVDSARAHAEAGMKAAASAGRQGWLLRNRAVLGFLELSLGEYAAAAEQLAPIPGQLAEMGVRDPGVYLVGQDVIEALIGAGDLDRAGSELASLEEHGRELDRPWALCVAARCRGLLLAAQGDLDGALASLEQAIVEHERLPMPFERARTLLALGQVQRRVKQRRAARETLESAQAVFEELGAVLWVTKAREELARIGGRKASAGALTPTEQRVAELVAEGRSNKEVAAALFVSVKTVEANLSRVYAKLGIRSRAELASGLAAVKM